ALLVATCPFDAVFASSMTIDIITSCLAAITVLAFLAAREVSGARRFGYAFLGAAATLVGYMIKEPAVYVLPCLGALALTRARETPPGARAAALAARAGAVARVLPEAAESADARAALRPLRPRLARPREPRRRRRARGDAAMAPHPLLDLPRGAGDVGAAGSADAPPGLDRAPVGPQRSRQLSGAATAETGVLGLLAHYPLRVRHAVCADAFHAAGARRQGVAGRRHREGRLRDTLDHP